MMSIYSSSTLIVTLPRNALPLDDRDHVRQVEGLAVSGAPP